MQAIGRRLARPGETLEFHLTERPEINAFAAPGGVVVVNSGLLKRAARDRDRRVEIVNIENLADIENNR